MSDKSCCWSVTINNPTSDDIVRWSGLTGLHWVKGVSGQVEVGAEGTPHIQGMVRTASVRHAQVRAALPRAHIEAAKSPEALARYVVKEETRVSAIPTVRTATQLDVQKAVYHCVINDCYYRQAQIDGCQYPPSYRVRELLTKYTYEIRRDWETHVDTAVRALIREGYFGVEYVMANSQVRMAFKKYLPEICYRYARESIQETQNRPQDSPPEAASAAGS